MYDSTKPEKSTVAVNFNDRLGRRIVFVLNHDQHCVVAAWIEEDPKIRYDHQITNTELYAGFEKLLDL